jgi:hypothetical protein
VPTRRSSSSVSIETGVPRSAADSRARRPPFGVALLPAVILLASCASPPAPSHPSAPLAEPEAIRARPDEVPLASLAAEGSEIYACERSGERLLWRAKGSEAELLDDGNEQVGLVMPGGYFIAEDGSYLIGNTTADVVVASGALAWQRIAVRFNMQNDQQKGRFAHIVSIQRVATSGGLPPEPVCDQVGAALFVPFHATYRFYRAAVVQQADAAAVSTPVLAPSIAVFRVKPNGSISAPP